MTKDFCDMCGDEVTEREDKYISVSCTPEITPELSMYGKNIVLCILCRKKFVEAVKPFFIREDL